jgi:VWFA-related protein
MRISKVLATAMVATALAQQQGTQSFQQQPQPPADDITIRINVNLVQVDAVVTDNKGKHVTDLKAEDFEILQDGKPQVITNFGYITTRPAGPRTVPVATPKAGPGAPPAPPPKAMKPSQIRRTVAMVVDDLGLSFESMARVRQSIKKWVDEQMQPGDLVAVIRTGAGMGALQQFTADRRMLAAAIERCKFNPFGRTSIGSFAAMGTELDAAGRMDESRETWFSVGTLGAINYVVSGLRELPGRKSILLFSENMRMFNSEGSNQQVMERMRNLTDAANRASVVIYSIDPRGLETFALTAADNTSGMSQEQLNNIHMERSRQNFESKEGLSFLAKETGGIFFENNNDIAGGVRTVMEDQEGYYLIGYHPDASTFDQKSGRRLFHNVKVKVRKSGLQVRSRNGFYGVSDQENRPRIGNTRNEQLQHALVSPFGSAGIGLRLTSLFTHVSKEQLKPVAAKAKAALAEYEKLKNSKNARAMREARLNAERLAAAAKTENYVTSWLYIEAKDLAFTDSEGEKTVKKDGQDVKQKFPAKKAQMDILVINFGDNGQEIDRTDATYTITAGLDEYKRIQESGLVYTVRHPIRKAGAYQLRVALRDGTSQKVGSATQFIEVPDVSKGRLQLSSLIVRGDIAHKGPATQENPEGKVDEPDPKASPVLRTFKPGRPLTYAYQVLNAQGSAKQAPQLESVTRVFREGKPIYEGKPLAVTVPGEQKDPKSLIAAGRMQLGGKMPPGDYVLQVIVTDKLATEKKRTASQWMDFMIEP